MVLRIELIENIFHTPGVGLGGTKKDCFTRQNSVGIFNCLFHELADDQGIGTLINHLLFKLGSLKVDVFDILALQDQLFLVFQRNSAFADAFHLEFGLNLHNLKIAEIRRHVVYSLFIGISERGNTVFAVK